MSRDPIKKPGVLRWTRTSSLLLGILITVIGLVMYIWWPLVQEYISSYDPRFPLWMQVDWLLIGIFLFMTLMITFGVDLRKDVLLALTGLGGGFLIESWGTHTGLWAYYTGETPPLWILPAWPIAALTIEKMVETIYRLLPGKLPAVLRLVYGLVMGGFMVYMLIFAWPTITHPFTLAAIAGVAVVLFSSRDHNYDLVIFLCGSLLGIFLETWGTTRLCWTYYTRQTPPLFAILAHGLASVGFWRVYCILKQWLSRLSGRLLNRKNDNPADC